MININLVIVTAGAFGLFLLSYFGYAPLFFPKYLSKIVDENRPTYYDVDGKIIPRENSRKILPISQPIPQYNFNADTTATITPTPISNVNKNIILKIDESINGEPIIEVKAERKVIELEKEEIEDEHTEDIIGYCQKCKNKQVVINPITKKVQTRKGIKTHINGKCALCGGYCGGYIKTL